MVEVIDMVSGEVVGVYGGKRPSSISELELVEVETDQGKVMVPSGVDLSSYRFSSRRFCRITSDLILQRIVEGESLYKVCQDPAMPSYATVCRWKRDVVEFREDLDQARIDRAEYYADRAVDEGMAAFEKDDVPVAQLKHNVMKWAAGVGDAGKFGTKTKIVGDKNAPVSFIIDTGIRRIGDTGYNVDETQEAHEGLRGSGEVIDVGGTSEDGHVISSDTDIECGDSDSFHDGSDDPCEVDVDRGSSGQRGDGVLCGFGSEGDDEQ